MTSSFIPRSISALWLSLALLTFFVLDPASARNWLVVMTIGIVPGLLLLNLWRKRLPLTLIGIIPATDARR